MRQAANGFRADAMQALRGVMMGAADVVPGVSGGTVALILGIYERLVTAISHFDVQLLSHLRRRRWSQAAAHVDLRFLISLGCGILLGIGGLAKLMKYLLESHAVGTLSVFFGLILASSVLVARMVGRWSAAAIVFAVAGAAFGFWLTGIAKPVHVGYVNYAYLFFCGTIAICAMILPGISGSFVLVILGTYRPVLDVISQLVEGKITLANLAVITVFASGCACGLLSFSKLLRWLLAHHRVSTMATLCGFMVGSLRGIWPFKHELSKHIEINVWPGMADFTLFVLIALLAMAAVFIIDRLGNLQKPAPILHAEDHEPGL